MEEGLKPTAPLILLQHSPLLATQHIRAMRGGSQAHLMIASDDECYVVKFQNNPQGSRVLANDLLASRLARLVGLSVPPVEVIDVGCWLIEHTPELRVRFKSHVENCREGLQFGSRIAGGLLPGKIVDYLPEPQLVETTNLREFAGMLVLDKWTCNSDGRQALFVQNSRRNRYSSVFIDQGHCFNASTWKYVDLALRGVFPRNIVYAHVTGWSSFNPWLDRIEAITEEEIYQHCWSIPTEWYGDASDIEVLVTTLLDRRCIIRDLITAFRNSDRHPFPMWTD